MTAIDENDDRRPLPLIRWGVCLIGVASLVCLVQILLVPLWTEDEISRRLARKAIVAATVVTTAASIFGFVPVTMLRRLGGVWADFGWTAALPFRFGLSLAGGVALVTVGKLPLVATLLAVVIVYFALLASETILMVRFTNAASGKRLLGAAGNEKR